MFSQANGQALRYHYDPSRSCYAPGYYPVMHQASGYTQQGMFFTFPYPGHAPAGFHHGITGTNRESDLDVQFDRQMTLDETRPPHQQPRPTTMPTPSASAGDAAVQRSELENFKLFAQEAELLDHHKFEHTVNININRALFDDKHSPCFFSSLAVNTTPEYLLRLIYHLSQQLHQADPTHRYGYRPPRIDERDRWPLSRATEATADRHRSERHAPGEYRAERSSEGSSDARQRTRHRERMERIARDETTTAPASSRRGDSSRQPPRPASPQRTPVPRRDTSSRTTTLPPSTPSTTPTHHQELEDLRERFITQQVELEALKKKAIKTCTICYEADIDCVFLECLHMYCCAGCAMGCVQDGRSVCSICRRTTRVPGWVKVFMS